MSLPSLPPWDGLHPLIVHFPIALLLVAPLFIAAGLAVPRLRPTALAAALVLMVLGTAGAWVAVATGEAGAAVLTDTAVYEAALEHHAELGETVRTVFSLLTLAFAALVLHPRILRRPERPSLTRVLGIGFLVAYLAGAVVLANTADAGGRLVHHYGIHAKLRS